MVSSESIFYTYAYLRKGDRTPYYIGKGKDNRAFVKHKGISVPKDRSKIIFLKQNLTEAEAFKHEEYMISVFGRKDLGTGILLNRTNGGEGSSGCSEEERERRRKTGKACYENGVGIHAQSKEQLTENGKKGGKISGNKHKENKTGIFGLSSEEKSEYSRKGGITQGNINKENKIGIFCLSSEEKSENSRKSGSKHKENKTGIFGRSVEKHSQDSKKAGKTTSAQKWQCIVTGHTSNAGGLTRYQKTKGIDTSKRIKVDGPRGWEITFEDGSSIVTEITLKDWAKENGYNYSCLCDVRKSRIKNHKGVVKVFPL